MIQNTKKWPNIAAIAVNMFYKSSIGPLLKQMFKEKLCWENYPKRF